MALVKPGEPYSRARDRLRTFDLLFFRGKGLFAEAILRAQLKSAPSTGRDEVPTHVGMVVRGEQFPVGSPYRAPGAVYVFESTSSGKASASLHATTRGGRVVEARGAPPSVAGTSFSGTQLRNLDEVMEGYDGREGTWVRWAPLRDSVRESRGLDADGEASLQYWNEVFRELNGRHYAWSVIELLASVFSCCRAFRGCNERLRACCVGCCSKGCAPCRRCADNAASEWQFCSELVSRVYIAYGLLAADANPEDVTPLDLYPARGLSFDRDGKVPDLFEPPVLVTAYPALPV